MNGSSLNGVHSLRGHFVGLEKMLVKELAAGKPDTQLTMFETDKLLTTDIVFKELVVQRSRAYVRARQLQQGGKSTMFPERKSPQVADYSVKKTYGNLLKMVEAAFETQKPLFVLGIYYPLFYVKEEHKREDTWEENNQKAVCGLIRTQFLKRFESSAQAFEVSCNPLLIKLLAWTVKHSETIDDKKRLERRMSSNAELVGYLRDRQLTLFGDENEQEAEEDLISPEMIDDLELLDREKYDVHQILEDTRDDLNQIADFLNELKKFQPEHDDKLKALVKLLRTDPVMKSNQVLIFSEFTDTAPYLKRELIEAGIPGVDQIDGSQTNRGPVIRRFAPYYTGTAALGGSEIRILISTDVLSEGLNLQD